MPPYGLALDLRWFKRKAYWTNPGSPGGTDGKVQRCTLDKGHISTLCTPEDLTSTITTGLGTPLVDPKGLALDVDNDRMYWVDSGVPGGERAKRASLGEDENTRDESAKWLQT